MLGVIMQVYDRCNVESCFVTECALTNIVPLIFGLAPDQIKTDILFVSSNYNSLRFVIDKEL